MDFLRHITLTAVHKMERSGLNELPDRLMVEIYKSGMVWDEAGQAHPMTSGIHPQYARSLYYNVLKYKVKLVMEIGMAEGLSTLSILAALRDSGKGGILISIDPHQHKLWRGTGIANVRRAGLIDHHQLVESPDYLALPELLRQGVVLDFAYVDGRHTFDHTLLDFFYVDKLLRIGGIIGFNDCGYRAVRRVLGFVRTHRKYQEQNEEAAVGARGCGYGPAVLAAARSLLGRADRYFKKIEEWTPPWNFYCRF